MASHTRSVLSPALSAKLAALNARTVSTGLDDVLAELALLPAHLVVRAGQEISKSARLGWWQMDGRSFQIVPSLTVPVVERVTHFLTSAAHVPSDNKLHAANPRLAWLFLFHPSGYIREAALHSIKTPPVSPFFVAALALRLNDWVEPVRDAARRCFARVMPDIEADVAAVAASYVLGRRNVWSRWTKERDVLDQLFARREVISTLVMLLSKGTTGQLALSLHQALRYPEIDAHLITLARHARQPSVRALAYRCLISGEADWIVGFEWLWIDKVYSLRRRVPKLETRKIERTEAVADLVLGAVRDRSVVVRKVAADALIAGLQLPDRDAMVTELATDKSQAIRSRADFLRRHPLPPDDVKT